jgi:hypothetical protein
MLLSLFAMAMIPLEPQILSPDLPTTPADRPALQACLEKEIAAQTPVTSILGMGSFRFASSPSGPTNTKILHLDVIHNLLPKPPTYSLQLRALENGPWVQHGVDTGVISYAAPSMDSIAWLARTNALEGTIYLVDLSVCAEVLRQ